MRKRRGLRIHWTSLFITSSKKNSINTTNNMSITNTILQPNPKAIKITNINISNNTNTINIMSLIRKLNNTIKLINTPTSIKSIKSIKSIMHTRTTAINKDSTNSTSMLIKTNRL